MPISFFIFTVFINNLLLVLIFLFTSSKNNFRNIDRLLIFHIMYLLQLIESDIRIFIIVSFFVHCQDLLVCAKSQPCNLFHIVWCLNELHFMSLNVSDPNVFSNWINDLRWVTIQKEKRSFNTSIDTWCLLNKVCSKRVSIYTLVRTF